MFSSKIHRNKLHGGVSVKTKNNKISVVRMLILATLDTLTKYLMVLNEKETLLSYTCVDLLLFQCTLQASFLCCQDNLKVEGTGQKEIQGRKQIRERRTNMPRIS